VRDAFAGVEIPASPDAVSAGGEGTGAAVLVVLAPSPGAPVAESCEPDTQASVVLIRRAGHLRANPGEIAFPGGRLEVGEAPLGAALREALEEVALPAEAIEVLGELPVVHAGRASVPILPFVAVAGELPALRACPDEVDCVLVVPLGELVAPGRYWQELWNPTDEPAWVMHFFDLGEDVVWGATARMLYELFVRLFSPASDGRRGGPRGGRTRPAWRATR
jgi:8-oxo-dGTP pyrophosphatase MutT (NUDIX family)